MAGPSRIAAALDYLERLKAQADQASTQTQLQAAKVARDFAGGVGQSLANRARDLGQMGYEAFTSAPSTPQTTAEFAELASQRQPTPMLDATAQGLGQFGKALVTDPVGTGRAMVSGELERARTASTSPAAAGEYAGSFIDPMRIAKALRAAPSVRELIVHHGTPHMFEPTEANPLGEFDASKIGTGEGAQAYGHGVYLAESPDVAHGYAYNLGYQKGDMPKIGNQNIADFYSKIEQNAAKLSPQQSQLEYQKLDLLERLMGEQATPTKVLEQIKGQEGWNPKTLEWFNKEVAPKYKSPGSLYKADLPDEMIDKMLDWDKPLSEQPENVREAFKRRITSVEPIDKFDMGGNSRLRDNRLGQYDKTRVDPWILETPSANGTSTFGLSQKDVDRMFGNKDVANLTGGQIISRLAQQQGGQAAASKYLADLGIPGIKYLDSGSRGAEGTGTRNFVVFPGEEKKVKILERK